MSQRTRPTSGSGRIARRLSRALYLDYSARRIAQHGRRAEHTKKRRAHRAHHRGKGK